MAITEILVHVDETPAAEARLRAAAGAGGGAQGACQRALSGRRAVHARAGRPAPARGLRPRASGRHSSARPTSAWRRWPPRRGQGRQAGDAARDRLRSTTCRRSWPGRGGAPTSSWSALAPTPTSRALTEAAFMDTGRPALVVPTAWAGAAAAEAGAGRLGRLARGGARRRRRGAAAADGRGRGRAHRGRPSCAGAGSATSPGFGLTTYLTRHGAKARVKQVAASGGIADTILAQVGEEQADLLVMGGYGHSRDARDDVRRGHPLDPRERGLPDPGRRTEPADARDPVRAARHLRLIERPRPEPRPRRGGGAHPPHGRVRHRPAHLPGQASLSRISARHGSRAVGRDRRRRRGATWPRATPVYVMPYLTCGSCIACRQGKTNCCTTLQCLGVHCDGGMCDYLALPERRGVPDRRAAARPGRPGRVPGDRRPCGATGRDPRRRAHAGGRRRADRHRHRPVRQGARRRGDLSRSTRRPAGLLPRRAGLGDGCRRTPTRASGCATSPAATSSTSCSTPPAIPRRWSRASAGWRMAARWCSWAWCGPTSASPTPTSTSAS